MIDETVTIKNDDIQKGVDEDTKQRLINFMKNYKVGNSISQFNTMLDFINAYIENEYNGEDLGNLKLIYSHLANSTFQRPIFDMYMYNTTGRPRADYHEGYTMDIKSMPPTSLRPLKMLWDKFWKDEDFVSMPLFVGSKMRNPLIVVGDLLETRSSSCTCFIFRIFVLIIFKMVSTKGYSNLTSIEQRLFDEIKLFTLSNIGTSALGVAITPKTNNINRLVFVVQQLDGMLVDMFPSIITDDDLELWSTVAALDELNRLSSTAVSIFNQTSGSTNVSLGSVLSLLTVPSERLIRSYSASLTSVLKARPDCSSAIMGSYMIYSRSAILSTLDEPFTTEDSISINAAIIKDYTYKMCRIKPPAITVESANHFEKLGNNMDGFRYDTDDYLELPKGTPLLWISIPPILANLHRVYADIANVKLVLRDREQGIMRNSPAIPKRKEGLIHKGSYTDYLNDLYKDKWIAKKDAQSVIKKYFPVSSED